MLETDTKTRVLGMGLRARHKAWGAEVLSLDVEHLELIVLEHFPFSEHVIRVIVVTLSARAST